jgi:hypothetical protein
VVLSPCPCIEIFKNRVVNEHCKCKNNHQIGHLAVHGVEVCSFWLWRIIWELLAAFLQVIWPPACLEKKLFVVDKNIME